MKEKPDECQSLFVNGFLNKELAPDSDYLYSLMVAQFSEEGCTKRTTEKAMMDAFQYITLCKAYRCTGVSEFWEGCSPSAMYAYEPKVILHEETFRCNSQHNFWHRVMLF